jgi:CRP-like cAMP-binding protein
MNAWAKVDDASPISVSAVTEAVAAKEEARRLLRGLGISQTHQAGSSIFNLGDNANEVHRLESGVVALRRLPNGKRHIVDFRLPGEYFAVVHRPKHTMSAEASSNCELTAFRRGEVDEICDVVPSLLSFDHHADREAECLAERIAGRRRADGKRTGCPLSPECVKAGTAVERMRITALGSQHWRAYR